MSFSEERLYLKEHRLSDVLALIQVLALHELAHRDDQTLSVETQIEPRSASSWQALASEHPEFFRVKKDAFNAVSLVAQHVKPNDPNTSKREKLSEEMTQYLLSTAIELHDRQIRRADRWALAVPIWVAVITVIGTCAIKVISMITSLCLASQ